MHPDNKNIYVKLLLLSFSGFQTACLCFIGFGDLSWTKYWYLFKISISMVFLFVLMKEFIFRKLVR
jgi:hypothetical protein